mmetsp:Transcript_28919/g.33015  ORF Transcript_28919/g.33015 Transcript_28919/m.33015 type:complete len:134 (-) Transcript_28919:285-686(-)
MNGPSPYVSSFEYGNIGSQTFGGARRRLASPAVIFNAFFTSPDSSSGHRGISITREVIGISPSDFTEANFFSSFGIFNSLFQELVGDIFNQESFMHNFHSNFRSSDIFQDIINQSAQAAQEAAKKPTSKAARK